MTLKLVDTGIILEESTRIYMDENRQYKGITRMISGQLFPKQFEGIPQHVLDKASERGKRIHSELQTYDIFGDAKSEEQKWYEELIKQHEISVHANEYIVTDNENYASPIDKVADMKGELILIDVKCTYKLNLEYVKWQLSIYKYFFELNNPHLKVGGLYVLHVKDGARIHRIKPIDAEIVKELIRCEINGEQFRDPTIPTMTKTQAREELEKRAQIIEENTSTEIAVVDAKDFGIEEKTAKELTVGLAQILSERELLIREFDDVSKLEINTETIPQFKSLRLKIVKNRTQGINKWHKLGKEYFLRGGQFLDAMRNKEIAVNENMEKVLKDGEDYFDNLEKERLEKIQKEREEKISKYVEETKDYSKLDEDEFTAVFEMKKREYEERIQAEAKAEEERIQAEAKAEEERIQAEAEAEKNRIKLEKENAKLRAEAEKAKLAEKAKALAETKKAEAEAKEKAKIQAKHDAEIQKEKAKNEKILAEAKAKADKIQAQEKAKREKLEAELRARNEAEEKAKKEAEEKIQADLAKGDEAKMADLNADLETLKTKYEFKAENSKAVYRVVSNMIEDIQGIIREDV